MQSAVNFINTNYNNIDKWWNKSDTQSTIDKFCECYCKRTENLDKELKKNLNLENSYMLGKKNKPYFIAEISSNHNGSFNNAKKN